jgi:hypothetical protein
MFFKKLFFSHYNLFGVGVRAIVFSLILAAFGNSRNLGFFLLFIATAFYFYLRPFFEAKKYFFSFLIFLIVAALMVCCLLGDNWNFIIAAILGAAFFAILGIKNLVFINRLPIYEFINNFIFFLVFVSFFISDKSSGWFFLEYLALFLAVFLLFRELISLRESQGHALSIPARINLFSVSLAVLTSQIVLVVAYLPIGFLNSAAVSLAAVLAFKDLAISHLRGELNRSIVLKNATIVLIFSIIVFIASKWQP